MTVIDEYTRESLAIRAGRSIRPPDVIDPPAELITGKGVPEHIRSDNDQGFTARAAREWLTDVGAGTLYIEPGSPSENAYVESFNWKRRDELLTRELFYTLPEVHVLAEQYNHWRQVRLCNRIRK